MSRSLKVLALLMVVTLTGCGGSPEDPESASRAQSLWSSRTPFVADSSRVAALVREVGPAPEGSYSISLRTETPPYTLTIDLERLDKPFDNTDFSGQATLLLGLVDNLDEVSVTSSEHAYSLTTDAASKDLGYDVKELGRDQERLTAYLDEQRD
jgi:hypothetical protein